MSSHSSLSTNVASSLCSLGKYRKKEVKLSPDWLLWDKYNQHALQVMWLVYNKISYHLVFGKWLWALVVSFQGQEWMCVKSWDPGFGKRNVPSHLVLILVCSMAGYSNEQFSLTHKVIWRWGKLRISLSSEFWLLLRPESKGKVYENRKGIIKNNYESVKFIEYFSVLICILKATTDYLRTRIATQNPAKKWSSLRQGKIR